MTSFSIERLPFHIGYFRDSHNPLGLPDTLPFVCTFDENAGLLAQVPSREVQEALFTVYDKGFFFGTPLNAEPHAAAYAKDFLEFVLRNCPMGSVGLEVGAGTGYLSCLLTDHGWSMTGVEPGDGYRELWRRSDVRMIRDRFPTNEVEGPFDVVLAYGVLEHLENLPEFFHSVKRVLRPEGYLVLAVPDCSEEIRFGDPGICVHEHLSFFTRHSLAQTLERHGFDGMVTKSGHGRSLYAVGRLKDTSRDSGNAPDGDEEMQRSYPTRVLAYVDCQRELVQSLRMKGTLAVYAPVRGLAFLDPLEDLRLVDDDSRIAGKYLPPFPRRIEGRGDLLRNPTDAVLVLSRTFGYSIRNSLFAQGYRGSVVLAFDDTQ